MSSSLSWRKLASVKTSAKVRERVVVSGHSLTRTRGDKGQKSVILGPPSPLDLLNVLQRIKMLGGV